MKKLARKWRNSGDDKFSLPIHDDEDSRPMGPQEQEEFVRSLEATQAENNRFWRRPYAYFMEDIYSWMIISADWMAVLVCSFSMKGLIDESVHHRRWIWYSWFTAIVPAMFWLYYMLRLPKFRWDVIFLPFGPLGGATICLYVDHLLSESSEEIRKLRGYMYSYKAG
ncbi:uncharacterized protein LOC107630632 isoform X3 [Arachis ipaensis]|uniref:uncharacterized protein LOC107630632 isoform X3 n=1 Tax=Arachis ipaensis TaxID=130454 RepID=UPI000A2B6A02|nr:uncharacterized protein LOC107630632 isoform X3 [Arachis ipaensis]XP_025636822.1 uncharacterized protein LOC112732341 isoform X4 [Arachis hypogaea]